MTALIEDAVSIPDMIAVFLGILELVKLRRIVLVERDGESDSVYGIDAEFVIGDVPAANDGSRLSSDFDNQPGFASEEVISLG